MNKAAERRKSGEQGRGGEGGGEVGVEEEGETVVNPEK